MITFSGFDIDKDEHFNSSSDDEFYNDPLSQREQVSESTENQILILKILIFFKKNN